MCVYTYFIYIHIYMSHLLYTRNYHDIVNQLHFNKSKLMLKITIKYKLIFIYQSKINSKTLFFLNF